MLKTERLHLRPTALVDAPFVLELMNSEGWIINIGDRNVHTIQDAEDYIRVKNFPQMEKLGYGNYTVLLGSTPIGNCGVYSRPGMDYSDLGFAFLEKYQGKGYAKEAAEAVLRYVYEDFGLDMIQAITLPTNVSSLKLLEKLGFKFVKNIYLPNDTAELSLLQQSLAEKFQTK